ncbi:MAG TPA: hypothetical protein VGC53_11855 [Vicinamibacteria bacterium]|jgi:hypothetical protein
MKIAILVIAVCLIPILLKAFELSEVAKRERSRRLGLVSSRDGKPTRSFDDADLEVYHRPVEEVEASPPSHGPSRTPTILSRDRLQERAFWRKEKSHHDQELARLDAQIRRLEWRLAERKTRQKPGERLQKDPTEHVLGESIQSLREERTRLIQAFHERARKAGALPGWLR